MSIIQQRRSIQASHACFYAACVVAALDYMHSFTVAYRDLKPENILVDRDGYVKVVDLGFAKALNGRSCTFCGTPDYMAPEILQVNALACALVALGCPRLPSLALGCPRLPSLVLDCPRLRPSSSSRTTSQSTCGRSAC